MTVTVIVLFKLALAKSKLDTNKRNFVIFIPWWQTESASVELYSKPQWQISWNLDKTIYLENPFAYWFAYSLKKCLTVDMFGCAAVIDLMILLNTLFSRVYRV